MFETAKRAVNPHIVELPPGKVKLLTPWEVFATFDHYAKLSEPGELVYAHTMEYFPDHHGSAILNILEKARRGNGANSRLNVDGIVLVPTNGATRAHPYPKYFWSEREHQKIEELKVRIEKAKQAGVSVMVTGKDNLLSKICPIYGRNHMKLLGVGKKMAIISGINFSDGSFNNWDFGVMFNKEEIVDEAVSLFEAINSGSVPENDFSKQLNPNYRMHIDAGKPFKSGIYDEAINMAVRARKNIVLVSQFPPAGVFSDVLVEQAERGVKVDFYTSNKLASNLSKLPARMALNWLEFRSRNVPNLRIHHYPDKLHGKLLMTDTYEDNGEVITGEVLFGSHNFALAGVILGTIEDAIWSSDPQLIRQFYLFLRSPEASSFKIPLIRS